MSKYWFGKSTISRNLMLEKSLVFISCKMFITCPTQWLGSRLRRDTRRFSRWDNPAPGTFYKSCPSWALKLGWHFRVGFAAKKRWILYEFIVIVLLFIQSCSLISWYNCPHVSKSGNLRISEFLLVLDWTFTGETWLVGRGVTLPSFLNNCLSLGGGWFDETKTSSSKLSCSLDDYCSCLYCL